MFMVSQRGRGDLQLAVVAGPWMGHPGHRLLGDAALLCPHAVAEQMSGPGCAKNAAVGAHGSTIMGTEVDVPLGCWGQAGDWEPTGATVTPRPFSRRLIQPPPRVQARVKLVGAGQSDCSCSQPAPSSHPSLWEPSEQQDKLSSTTTARAGCQEPGIALFGIVSRSCGAAVAQLTAQESAGSQDGVTVGSTGLVTSANLCCAVHSAVCDTALRMVLCVTRCCA